MKHLLQQPCLIIVIACLFSNAAFSQNWSTIKDTSRISFYKKKEGNYFAHKMDSVKAVGADSVYTTYSTYWNEKYYIPNDTSWVGRKVIKKPYGKELFITCKGDSLALNTRAVLNEHWVFCKNGNYQATVTGIEQSLVLGMEDSIKTIQIASQDSIRITIRLSKHYGFVSVPVLKYFPYEIPESNMTLSGIQGLAGFQNLAEEEFFNFDIGDEFEWETRQGAVWGNPPSNDKRTFQYNFIKITGKITALKYILTAYTYIETYIPGYPDSYSLDSVFNDTVSYQSALPDHKLPTSENKSLYPTTASIYLYDFSKEYVAGGDLSYSVIRFSTGIGRQQQLTYVSNSIGSGEVGEKLTYYKKGETIFGQRVKYVINGIEDEISLSNEIRLYPNPASGYVSINVPDNLPSLELILTDLTGFVIKQIKSKGEIDVSLLAPGFYIYTVKSGQQILKTGKLLINR